MLFSTARKIWDITKWIWLTFLIVFLISLTANLLVVRTTDLSKTVLVSILNWYALFGYIQLLIISILVFFVIATLLSLAILGIEEHIKGGKTLRKYLHTIEEANQGLNPRGFAQQSQALISVNVPLEDIYIHLNAIPDRPIYDIVNEQQELLEQLRQNPTLSLEEREERSQRLRITWYSQLGQSLLEPQRKQNIAIEEVVQQLKAEHPVAIILGTPGSGKSTALRWLALHLARGYLTQNYTMPKGLIVRQIPILVHINDYAKRLNIQNLSFEEFLKDVFTKVHRDLPTRLFEELEKGHCFLLFDGLDEVASDSSRLHITEAISTFISIYSSEKSNAKHYNRFIITSRIVGYQPGTFADHAHYTLLDLKDNQIEQFLTNWCPAVEFYQSMFAQGMKPLTSQQEKQAKLSGEQQRDRLLDALRKSPSIKRLAVNPLMLTILALIQRSGRTLPHRRIELYQIITRTLLDNWNQDTGRKIFSVEEIPLAEQILVDLAYRLHTGDPVLLERDVKEIAWQAMTEFYGHPPMDRDIDQFIETLRRSSGLFIESGQGLFNFMHRTFQEYFVALYLLRKPMEDLEQFTIEHYRFAIWREPLLLGIAYKSGQGTRNERQLASILI